jgi:hypothetical protein
LSKLQDKVFHDKLFRTKFKIGKNGHLNLAGEALDQVLAALPAPGRRQLVPLPPLQQLLPLLLFAFTSVAGNTLLLLLLPLLLLIFLRSASLFLVCIVVSDVAALFLGFLTGPEMLMYEWALFTDLAQPMVSIGLTARWLRF